jgi:primary-amine oxidase
MRNIASDPFLSASSYFDTFYGFGIFNFELIPGYDCPPGATYLDSTFFKSDSLYTHPNSICMFEFDESYPINRHTSSSYASASKNTQFAIRTVATIGNYDYTVSYIFGLDGSITADIKASGYIQGGHSTNNQDYGFHIHDYLNGAMHDHVIQFKADFDILGTANSLEFVTNKAVSKVFPWSDGKVRNTMQIERTFVKNEDQARFNWAPNSATQVLVVNKDKPNKFGEYPGWRVIGKTGGSHLTILNSSTILNAGRWAEYDVQVTRQKDTEPRSVHPYNNMDTPNPPVDFSKYFNSESLDQQDVVVWVNVGMHHVPHTGDLPNTVMTSAHGAVQFVPSNYFLGDPSVRAASRVRVNYNNGVVNTTKVGRPADVCVNDLGRYTGDYAVHLYPYDPEHPFYDTYSIP